MIVPARTAHAQPDTQVWAEITFSWAKSHAITYGLDVEPKVLVSAPPGDPGWSTLDLTPSIEYKRGQWFDALGELLIGRTRQTDDLNSTEVTPRIGMRFHLLSNLRDELGKEGLIKERRPKHRVALRDLVRVEWRNLYYSTDKPQSSTVRLRNRLELSTPSPVLASRMTGRPTCWRTSSGSGCSRIQTSATPTGSESARVSASGATSRGASRRSTSGTAPATPSTRVSPRPTTSSTSG